jgi:hypothetical protein
MLLTTPARTVIDLARTLDFRAGVVAADSALHRNLTTPEELRSVLAACPLRSGIRRAAEVVEFAHGLAESPLESIARVVFRDSGLPPPELQVWLGGPTEPAARVDFYWKKYRTIAEVDGSIKYADPLRASNQLRRDAILRAEGFEIVHFGWQEITENPAFVLASIKTAFRRSMLLSAGLARLARSPLARSPIKQGVERGTDALLRDGPGSPEYLREEADPQFLELPADRDDVGAGAGLRRQLPTLGVVVGCDPAHDSHPLGVPGLVAA